MCLRKLVKARGDIHEGLEIPRYPPWYSEVGTTVLEIMGMVGSYNQAVKTPKKGKECTQL